MTQLTKCVSNYPPLLIQPGFPAGTGDKFITTLPLQFRHTLDMVAQCARRTFGEEAVTQQSSIQASAFNVTFAVTGRSSVPADGSSHRVTLRQQTLNADLKHHTVPGFSPKAYLIAKTTSPDESTV